MNEQTPEYMSLSRAMDAATIAKTGDNAADRLKTKELEADPNAPRMFLCPQYPTGKFLVAPGKVRVAQNPGGHLGMEPTMERLGDIWVKFTSGVYALAHDNPYYDETLAWLEAHSGDPDLHTFYHTARNTNPRNCSVPIGLCQESGPGVGDWAEMKAGQMATSRRAASISPELDVDGYFLRGRVAKHMTSGEGQRMADTALANSNAAAQRAAGQRNNT